MQCHTYSLFCFLYCEPIWCSYLSEITSWVISWSECLLLPHINIVILFPVVVNVIPCHFTKYIFQSFQHREMTCSQKFIIHRHIPIRSFISVLISEHIIYLIFLWMTYYMTYLKFLFLDSFLSRSFIWHSPYHMHMICHLCFRRHIRFRNYNFPKL